MTPPAPDAPAMPSGGAGAPANADGPGAGEPDGAEPDGPGAAEPPSGPAPAAQVISACREETPTGCDNVFIRVVKSAPDLCVQLVLDNCAADNRLALRVATPFSWRLSSGSASANKACALNDYDPKSAPALGGTGSLRWVEEGSAISDVEFDIQLQLAPPPESTLPPQIGVATEEALSGIVECD